MKDSLLQAIGGFMYRHQRVDIPQLVAGAPYIAHAIYITVYM
jgi:hypothetical protein